MTEKIEYLIVGQGLAGTILGAELLRRNKKICILNKEKNETSSLRAGGIYNPITGRKMVKTWMADELFHGLEDYYRGLEQLFGAFFLSPKNIYRPFFNIEEQNDWQGKAGSETYRAYIEKLHVRTREIANILDPFGGLELKMSGSLDVPEFLRSGRSYFKAHESYREGTLNFEELQATTDGWIYQDFQAEKIIFCEGPDAIQNPLLKGLKFKPVKGEILDIRTTLSDENIVNRGVFMLPKKGFFRVGSTYDHKNLNYQASDEGATSIREKLVKIFSGEYEIISHFAGIRPATFDRRPFIGKYRQSLEQIYVFNGFGTKGVSLIPFFVIQFLNYLQGNALLQPEVDVNR